MMNKELDQLMLKIIKAHDSLKAMLEHNREIITNTPLYSLDEDDKLE